MVDNNYVHYGGQDGFINGMVYYNGKKLRDQMDGWVCIFVID